MDFQTYLKSRNISDEVISYLRNEKIDENIIAIMKDEDLDPLFEKKGDRIAIKDFCLRHRFPNSRRKHGLLEKLKKTIKKSSLKSSSCKQLSDSSDSDGGNSSQPKKKQKHTSEKETRQIYLGWFNSEDGNVNRQIRGKKGGGSRKVEVPKTYVKEDLIALAKDLFFPNGVSKFGNLKDFELNLLDFSGEIVPANVSVNDILTKTKVKDLRLYLHTTRRERENSPTEFVQNGSATTTEAPEDHNVTPVETTTINESLIPTTGDYLRSFYPNDENEQELLQILSSDTNIEINENIDNVHEIFHISETESHASTSITNLRNDIKDPTLCITLHRGNVFEELLGVYKNLQPTSNTQLEIKMISSNGTEEMGVDVGGVFRDALTEFWSTFYEKNTLGTDYKIPTIRHDFHELDWKAVGLIIAHGYRQEGYFPIKMAPVLFEYCIEEKLSSDLIDTFSKFVSAYDAQVIKTAMQNFDDAEPEELLDILTNYDAKWIPKKENIEQLINDIAHKELIQKPMYIIKCWMDYIRDLITIEELKKIYQEGVPSEVNICKNLRFNETASNGEKVCTYLKRFLKEASQELKEAFLRFCTGSNMVRGPIHIHFNHRTGWERRPVAHTCVSQLELSVNYENFLDFRNEFTAILASNFWSIDVI